MMPSSNSNFSRIPIQSVYEGLRPNSNDGFERFYEILNYYEFRADQHIRNEHFQVLSLI